MSEIIHRIRIKFSKDGALRFIGHLDLQQLLERSLRRSAIPLHYSQGFNPKVRINIACALPLGFSSTSEFMDFWMEGSVDLSEIQNKISNSLPKDLSIIKIYEVSLKEPSLQSSVLASEYEITFPPLITLEFLRKNLDDTMNLPQLIVQRKQKSINIRPFIESYRWLLPEIPVKLLLRLKAMPAQNGRPDELLRLLDIEPGDCRIHRTNLFFSTQENQQNV